MFVNKPTVILLKKELAAFHPDVQELLDDMHKAGILHYSPLLAAEHIEKVYDNIDIWWNDAIVQDVKKRFVEKYASCKAEWNSEWISEFERLLH